MAAMNFNIHWETRPCEVNGRIGYFHTWEQFSQTVAASPFIGGEPAGVIARCFGLVEFDGVIERVEPTRIKFTDVYVEKEKHNA